MNGFNFDYETGDGKRITYSADTRTLVVTDYDADERGMVRAFRVGVTLPDGPEGERLAELIRPSGRGA